MVDTRRVRASGEDVTGVRPRGATAPGASQGRFRTEDFPGDTPVQVCVFARVCSLRCAHFRHVHTWVVWVASCANVVGCLGGGRVHGFTPAVETSCAGALRAKGATHC